MVLRIGKLVSTQMDGSSIHLTWDHACRNSHLMAWLGLCSPRLPIHLSAGHLSPHGVFIVKKANPSMFKWWSQHSKEKKKTWKLNSTLMPRLRKQILSLAHRCIFQRRLKRRKRLHFLTGAAAKSYYKGASIYRWDTFVAIAIFLLCTVEAIS